MEAKLEDIVEYVKKQAENEAEQIRKKAESDYEKTVEDADRDFEERLDKQLEVLSCNSEERKAEFVRQENAKEKRRLTEYAAGLVDRLFVECEEKLNSLSTEEFVAFFRSSVSTLSLSGSYKVRLGEFSAGKLTSNDVSSVSEGKGFSLALDEVQVGNVGGFLLTRDNVEYSFLFPELLGEIKTTKKPLLIKKIAAREV